MQAVVIAKKKIKQNKGVERTGQYYYISQTIIFKYNFSYYTILCISSFAILFTPQVF